MQKAFNPLTMMYACMSLAISSFSSSVRTHLQWSKISRFLCALPVSKFLLVVMLLGVPMLLLGAAAAVAEELAAEELEVVRPAVVVVAAVGEAEVRGANLGGGVPT